MDDLGSKLLRAVLVDDCESRSEMHLDTTCPSVVVFCAKWSQLAGHCGNLPLLSPLKLHYWWSNLRKYYVWHAPTCPALSCQTIGAFGMFASVANMTNSCIDLRRLPTN